MAEIRFNPFKRDWTMIASHRQDRPQMPKGWCPFCPGSGKVPDHYDVLSYDNDFPALSQSPPAPDDVANDFFKTALAYGRCEVVLYSPNHTATMPELSFSHMRKLIDLWVDRCQKMSIDQSIKYIYAFENRGKEIGVTMPHPHGQIYGYPFIPQKIEKELESTKEYYQKNKRNLFEDWLKNEHKDGRRIIFEDDNFSVVLPFFSETVYGVQIVSRQNIQYLWEMDESEKDSLARTVRDTVGMLDSLFNIPMPYMLAMHQGPVNYIEDTSPYYRFHIEFIPVLRSKDKLQFFASSESGAGAYCNPTAPEEKAPELRDAYERYQKTLRARGE